MAETIQSLSIRDHCPTDTDRFEVYELTLTDGTLEALQEAVLKRKLKIKFEKSGKEGQLILDKNQPPKTFSAKSQINKNSLVYSHTKTDDFVYDYGGISQSYKMDASIKDSFNKAKESMKKVEEAKKASTAQELKRKDPMKKTGAPKYLKERERNKAIRHPGPEPAASRTTTPPPITSSTYGDLKKRVIHILALNNGKYQDKKLKEELSKRNLINGPEAKEVKAALECVATLEKNKCWYLTEDSYMKLDPQWPGYKKEQDRNIIAKVKEAGFQPYEKPKPRASQIRPETPLEDDFYPASDNNSRTSENSFNSKTRRVISPDTTSPAQSSKAMPLNRQSPGLSISSSSTPEERDSETASDRVSIQNPEREYRESHDSRDSSNSNSLSKMNSSRVESGKTAKDDLLNKYKLAKENREKAKRKPRESSRDSKRPKKHRTLSQEEILENGKKSGLSSNFLDALKIELERKYPALKSPDAESAYRAKYDEDFARFHVLKEQNSKIAAKFEKLQGEMSRLTEGTEPYESIREQVIQEYRQCVKDGYLKNVREYQETHQSPLEDSSAEDDLVSSLPGIDLSTKNFTLYSGFLNFEAKHYHYVFVERNGTEKWALWLNGGPGCSSMDGFLTENGPFRVHKDGSLVDNQFAWSKNVSILYLESPVDVGFTYSDNRADETFIGDKSTTRDNTKALEKFIEKFPAYSSKPLILTGESYAGIYISLLLEALSSHTTFKNILDGALIGNGMFDYGINYNTMIHFANGHGLIPPSLWKNVLSDCCKNITEQCEFYDPEISDICALQTSEVMNVIFQVGLNWYNIYARCVTKNEFQTRQLIADSAPEQVRRLFNAKKKLQMAPTCLSDLAIRTYLNKPEVVKALHVENSPASKNWTVCSDSVFQAYQKTYTDVRANLINYFRNTRELGKTPHLIIYNGDIDMACNFLGGRDFATSLNFRMLDDQRPWLYKDDGENLQLGGYVTQYEYLSFVTIKGSGHMVPTDQPEAALVMFQMYLENKW
ncbi:Oidioi.mRNA.OKI2018_I69.XSR.g13975.t2.cds [Oikopleura dioica]|uniref:Carboxypeptidase n=1 Tax=Oikopleura dioica TaxID=34765 RepID=A0ABN7SCI3_OIKDI|nr:Oidioi.mRNA.OKI2018_I69.XSR.g13975.t2.cds [Oikopleura dioica]